MWSQMHKIHIYYIGQEPITSASMSFSELFITPYHSGGCACDKGAPGENILLLTR